MGPMNRHRFALLFVAALLTSSGCSGVRSNISPGSARLRVAPTFAVSNSLVDSCALLNTHDLASLFPTHTETILPKPQISQVSHPAFFEGRAPGTETSCVYYSYYLPGSHSEIVLQVNYWLDVPGSGSTSQAWNASMRNAQSVPGIGDGSFYQDGQLNFKMGGLYMTVAATETDWNLSMTSDRNKQLALEKQVAEDMLSHLQ